MTGLLAGFLQVLRSPGPPLRPPGAGPEAEFTALCIRCSRCVEVCPYGTLVPAGLDHGLDAGTPLVRPRHTPCYLCMLCPPACPTCALDAGLTEARQVRMGLAEVDPATCYAHLGILCRTCLDACPFEGEAIRQDGQLRPVVTDRCVGCGLCEHACPADAPAIRVRPRGMAG